MHIYIYIYIYIHTYISVCIYIYIYIYIYLCMCVFVCVRVFVCVSKYNGFLLTVACSKSPVAITMHRTCSCHTICQNADAILY